MDILNIEGQPLEMLISEARIQGRVKELAQQISRDLHGRNPLLLCVLKGAFVFASDLMRQMTIPCEISFVELKSYQGTQSTGNIREAMAIDCDLTGRAVVVVEDIVESGLTMKWLMQKVLDSGADTVQVCTLFHKPSKMMTTVRLDYVGFSLADEFIVGYGLDYDEAMRGVRDVYYLNTKHKDKTMKNLVIFGAPGSGKGTQSDKLIEKYGFEHISTGDVLRAEIKNGTELGKTAKGYIDNGQLIPDELMVDILASVYDSFGREHKGVIFDGFPRTIPQAEALKEMLNKRGDKVAAMIELDVPEDELMKRLILRGQQSGRADDNEETIKKRLVVYHNQTAPLIEWYQKEGLHHHIDGLGELARIFDDISKVVDSL